MKEEVTKDMVLDVLKWAISDIEKERERAKEAYDKDRNDDFNGAMETALTLSIDMIRSRMNTVGVQL